MAANECCIQAPQRSREVSRSLGGQRERNLRTPVPRRARADATCRIPGVRTPARARRDCSSRRVRGPGRAPRCHRTNQLARARARRPASHRRRGRLLSRVPDRFDPMTLIFCGPAVRSLGRGWPDLAGVVCPDRLRTPAATEHRLQPAGGPRRGAERAVHRPGRRRLLGDGAVRGAGPDAEHQADRRSPDMIADPQI